MRTSILLALAICTGHVAAQSPPRSSGDFFYDLLQLDLAVNSIKWRMEICTESFPATRQVNEPAYSVWSERESALLAEIKQHRVNLVRRQTGGDEKGTSEVIVQMESGLSRARESVRAQLSASGLSQLESQCQNYPAYLKSEPANLEHWHRAQLAAVREALAKR
jgi:hypothetical protein